MEETAAIIAMESCIAGSQCMHSDKLILNSDNSECLLIGTRQQPQKVSNISTLLVGDSQIAPYCEVRNQLGTWFDSKMSMLVISTKLADPLSIIFITCVELGNI